MNHLFWDTETALFGPANMAPPLACVSWQIGKERGLVGDAKSLEWFKDKLSSSYIFVGHNVAYDFAVIAARFPDLIPSIFKAYEENRVTDTMIRQMLLDNAVGRYGGMYVNAKDRDIKSGKTINVQKFIRWGYSLDDCHYRAVKKRLDKDTWRLHYGSLRNLPLSKWPEGARTYPLDDATATKTVFDWQEKLCKEIVTHYRNIPNGHIEEPAPLKDQYAQARAAWWIQLMAVWGLRTSPERVHILEDFVKSEVQKLEDQLVGVGLVRSDGSRNTKLATERMIKAMGGQEKCKLTDKGNVKLDEEACRNSGDRHLVEYAELASLKVVLNKDIPALAQGEEFPIHSYFRVLLATGRTSSSSPNVQNVRRLQGIRETFVPRPGNVFLDCDYDTLELRTLAQTCIKMLGKSRLGEIINEGKDPHLMFGAWMLGITYEEALARKKDKEVKEARQLAKAANFGFPGGLGVQSFILFARGYGVELNEEEAKDLKNKWLRAFPEMRDYFAMISKHGSEDQIEGLVNVEHVFSKRLRGDCTYTAACNSYFQGLGADATKHAGFELAKACYVDKDSILFGCRIVNYIHDQFLVECPEEIAHEAAMEVARIMCEAANKYLPDVNATVSEPMVCRCWSKDAEQKWDKLGDDGKPLPDSRLIPWELEDGYKVGTKAS